MRTLHYFYFCLLGLSLFACSKEDTLKVNQPPDTQFSIDQINLFGNNRLNTVVSLHWFGSDPDGYVVGYELSLDQQNWVRTTKRDSTFHFSLAIGTDTTDVNLYVRAIDNENAIDPSAAHLVVPIKNTPPTVNFKEKMDLPDTSYLVATTEWQAEDVDGNETITNAYISLDGLNWVEVNKNKKVISIVPDNATATGTTTAKIYYEAERQPSTVSLNGLKMNDTNRLYLKVVDQAGTASNIDTSNTFFMKGKTNDVLVIGSVPTSNSSYLNLLNAANVSYDFIDFGRKNGVNQPLLWNITFRLQLSFYTKLFLYSNVTQFVNPYTKLKALLLDFAAPSLQDFVNRGGKYLITTNFDFNTDLDAFVGLLPIASVSYKNFGDARLYQDSIAHSDISGFPDLSPTDFAISGVSVFKIDSTDTEVLYEANLINAQNNKPWPDTKIIASGRRQNGKLNQVFFSVQLQQLNGKGNNLSILIDKIFNVEFN